VYLRNTPPGQQKTLQAPAGSNVAGVVHEIMWGAGGAQDRKEGSTDIIQLSLALIQPVTILVPGARGDCVLQQ
jgi:hypothetical protein